MLYTWYHMYVLLYFRTFVPVFCTTPTENISTVCTIIPVRQTVLIFPTLLPPAKEGPKESPTLLATEGVI